MALTAHGFNQDYDKSQFLTTKQIHCLWQKSLGQHERETSFAIPPTSSIPHYDAFTFFTNLIAVGCDQKSFEELAHRCVIPGLERKSCLASDKMMVSPLRPKISSIHRRQSSATCFSFLNFTTFQNQRNRRVL